MLRPTLAYGLRHLQLVRCSSRLGGSRLGVLVGRDARGLLLRWSRGKGLWASFRSTFGIEKYRECVALMGESIS